MSEKLHLTDICRSRSSRQRALPFSSTLERTSIFSEASPATAPRITPAGIPFKLPELGMITQRTFLMIFPEHFATIRSGSFPRISLALAAPVGQSDRFCTSHSRDHLLTEDRQIVFIYIFVHFFIYLPVFYDYFFS